MPESRPLRWLILPLLALWATPAAAQVVTHDPAFPTVTQPIVVYFHAAAGSGGLAGYTGDVYAHTGVITNLSNPKDGCMGVGWRHVKTNWGQNTEATKLERIAPDEYRLVISDIRQYYNVPAAEQILRLAFVFRSGDSSREGKDTGNCDIFIDLFEGGVNVQFAAPATSALNPLIAPRDTTVRIIAVANSSPAPLTLLRILIDDEEVARVEGDSLAYDLVLDEPGRRLDVRAIAENEVEEADTAFFYVVRNPAMVEAPPPAGTRDGINYTASSATLSLFAPHKEYVYLIGDFNDWEVHPDFFLTRAYPDTDSTRYWITLDGLEPGTEYAFQYLIDGDLRIADPYAEKVLHPDDRFISGVTYPNLKPYPSGKTQHYVSVLEVGREPFQWTAHDFIRPEGKDLVIYELLVRDFIGRHDYATLADTLDYLQRLGVNAIELMPINEFEGNESWGYNPAFYFAPDKYYGPAEDLKRLVDEAHRRGMAVIIDVVLNHAYGQSPMVRMYFDQATGRPSANNPWFNERHNFENPDAHWGYDFDHESRFTQAFVDRFTRFWLEEYRVDGFRFDFTKGIGNNFKPRSSDVWGSRYDADRVRLLKRMVDAMWEAVPGSYAIFEHLAENREDMELADYGILMWGNMNGPYNEATMGWHDGGKSNLSGAYYRSRGWQQPNLVTYMESHDEERMMVNNLLYGNASGSYSVKEPAVAYDRMKMAGAFFFTLPGPKMIWQFGELGYDVSIDTPCRVCNKPIRWNYQQDPLRWKLYKAWAALIALRHEHEVFTSRETTATLSVGGTVKRINLSHPSMDVTIVGNFGVTPASVAPNFQSAGTWYDFFTGSAYEATSTTAPIALEPGEFHIFTSKQVETPEPGLITVGTADSAELPATLTLHQNYPNPFNPTTTIRFDLPYSTTLRLEIFDLLGRRVALLADGLLPAGGHTVTFDAAALASGTYVYRLEAGGRREVRRMMVVK